MGGNKSKNTQKASAQAETFYKNICTDEMDSLSPKQQVELNISLKSANQGTFYSIAIFLEGNSKPVSETKKQEADSSNTILFEFSLILDYFFEKQQNLTFRVIKDSQFLSEVKTTLGSIMGARGQTLTKGVDTASLVISATALESNGTSVLIRMSINSKMNSPLFYIIKKSQSKELFSLYKSEVQSPSNGLYTFNQTKIPANLISRKGNPSDSLVIEFFDFYNKRMLQTHKTSLDNLTGNGPKFNLSTDQGTLEVNCLCSYSKEYTFIDYLKGGLQLNLTIGIDFTGSNGHPNDRVSLHYTGDNRPNDYEKAIRACGDIVAFYDYDQLFPVYGYGAILPGQNIVSNCFSINLSGDPNIHLIDNVLNTYRANLSKFNFSGPTLFAPILNNIISMIKSNNHKNSYQLLLILTDGMINDMNETVDALVEGSFLPLSVIIVGIGKSDFSNMEQLDADVNPLVDRYGRTAKRDLVQFVPFYKFESDGRRLAEEVLEEVPRQVVEYFSNIKCPPGDPIY